MADPLLIAKNAQTECTLLPGMANRRGLVTGATGTGKTVTLQTLAENFSKIGVPVFMADGLFRHPEPAGHSRQRAGAAG